MQKLQQKFLLQDHIFFTFNGRLPADACGKSPSPCFCSLRPVDRGRTPRGTKIQRWDFVSGPAAMIGHGKRESRHQPTSGLKVLEFWYYGYDLPATRLSRRYQEKASPRNRRDTQSDN